VSVQILTESVLRHTDPEVALLLDAEFELGERRPVCEATFDTGVEALQLCSARAETSKRTATIPTVNCDCPIRPDSSESSCGGLAQNGLRPAWTRELARPRGAWIAYTVRYHKPPFT
jgi:hypothetical protein